MTEPRSRFAPSPTGYLHIGGARTALFNYLFARGQGGRFVLRIEDTDRDRSTPEMVDAILDGLRWLGLEWDEGPLFQSERRDAYQAQLEELLAKGDAYRCYCTPEELEAMRERAMREGRKPMYDRRCRNRTDAPEASHVIRFRAPLEGDTAFDDLIKGPVRYPNEELDDLVLARSDGSPTYNFVVVVDDADMEISHVIRGEDHLNNTPKQIQLYRALGLREPRFAHVPLILGTDKQRLSKRHGAASVLAYRDLGYFPEALVNYLARLGWSHGDEEIFSLEELVEKFRVEDVGTSAGVFNPEKLEWVNFHYMKTLPLERLVRDVKPFLRAHGYDGEYSDEWLGKMITTLRERANTLVELVDSAHYYLSDEVEYDEKAASKFLKPQARPLLEDLVGELDGVEPWNEETIQPAFQRALERNDVKLGKLAQPVRVAVTGGTVSPGIYELLAVVGKRRTLERLRRAIATTADTTADPS